MDPTYDIAIRNRDWEVLLVLDNYESLVWTDKAKEAGDFELYMYYDPEIWKTITIGSYLTIPDSEHVMIVEKREIKDTFEDYPHMIFFGHSFEYVLNRRIIIQQRDFDQTKVGDIFNALLDENCIDNSPWLWQFTPDPMNPDKKYRGITGLYRRNSTWEDRFGTFPLDIQYQPGTTIYSEIIDLIKTYSHVRSHFIIKHMPDNRWMLDIEAGENRSWEQSVNDWVTFSSDFNNLKSSDFKETNENYANSFYVVGKYKDVDMIIPLEDSPASSSGPTSFISGLDRYEFYVNGSSIESQDAKNREIPRNLYVSKLTTLGRNEMLKHHTAIEFVGEVDPNIQWIYNKDYGLGDTVNVVDDFGNTGTCVVSGASISVDSNGIIVTPTFETVKGVMI